MTRIGLTAMTAAIAVILLTANFTIINAQQQGQATSQPSAIEDGAAAGATIFQSTTDSFGVQVPEGWAIHDVDNTGFVLLEEEAKKGYGILAQLCPEEEQQQQQPPTALDEQQQQQQQQPPTALDEQQQQEQEQQQPPSLENRSEAFEAGPPQSENAPTEGIFPPFGLPSIFP